MILVIDVGNTRIKWAWLTSSGLSNPQSIVHRGAKPKMWRAALFDTGQKPGRVLISNIAGDALGKTLYRLTKRHYGVKAQFVRAERRHQDLVNGYQDPDLLGADRWLAMIGAWTIAHAPLCVVDAGTAVTVDCVDAGGQHLGGLIAPGIHMMREALLTKTSDIAKAVELSQPSMAGALANNTIGAVSRGAVFALASMADRVVDTIIEATGTRPRVFITGGDAGMISAVMRNRGEQVPDLVLQGLAAIAAQSR
jgi:type III pantothenate kinase